MNNYSGGLAEIINSPSSLTYSYLKKWFSGRGSLGKAMKILGLPVKEGDLPVLEILDDQLVVNLENEEKTLYVSTIFKYKKQKNINDSPKLTVDLLKILNPFNLIGTLKILIKQSIWISNPESAVRLATQLVNLIPVDTDTKVVDVDKILAEQVWPNVLAVGVLAEFFAEVAKKDQGYITEQVSKKDWFFNSLIDQIKVKNSEMSFEEYIKLYGLRADKDYELTCPRWYEIPEEIIKRINGINHETIKVEKSKIKVSKTVDAAIELQILRLEAKRKALFLIDKLRVFLGRPVFKRPKNSTLAEVTTVIEGRGKGVSLGTIKGKAKHINSILKEIEKGTIGIFPSAGVDFSSLYPKCAGLIFLRGGQTSHGAIVAREFKIPAIVDNNAANIRDETLVEINGETGVWKIDGLT